MHYLANYYKNLSDQLQEKVNFLEKQLEEAIDTYVPVPILKTGKGGNYAEWKNAVDQRNAMKRAENLGLLGKKPERKPVPSITSKPETKPTRPGIPMFPERKPLIGKVPMLWDTDAIDVMPKPDMDAINVMPKPDTNTINITPQRPGYNINKPKIKRFGDSGPKLPLAPIKPQGSQNQNTATNIDFRNYEPIKLIQNERGKFKEL
jgi:hypothetical protein